MRPCLIANRPCCSIVGAQIQLAQPNIPESDGIAVVLDFDRAFLENFVVIGDLLVAGRSEVLLAVMSDDAVVNHGDIRLFFDLAFGVPFPEPPDCTGPLAVVRGNVHGPFLPISVNESIAMTSTPVCCDAWA